LSDTLFFEHATVIVSFPVLGNLENVDHNDDTLCYLIYLLPNFKTIFEVAL